MSFRGRLIAIAAGLGLAILASRALAALGEPYASVESDRLHLAARVAIAAAATHTTHSLTLPNGAVVREFTRADGTVFAVSWRGPSRPDLHQILGSRFAPFQARTARRTGPRIRRPIAIQDSDLIVNSAGHPGGFWGYAYIPSLVPAAFPPASLR